MFETVCKPAKLGVFCTKITPSKTNKSRVTVNREKHWLSKTLRGKQNSLFVPFFEPDRKTVTTCHCHCSACVCVVFLMCGAPSLMISIGSFKIDALMVSLNESIRYLVPKQSEIVKFVQGNELGN